MIAAGETWRPDCGLALGAGTQILAVEFIETWAGESQFLGGFQGGEFAGSMTGQ